jgi:rfaE bifunctional protein nucleotidyltransferase chain/domain
MTLRPVPNVTQLPTLVRSQARDKIKSLDELAVIAGKARAMGRTVVLAHGVFDLVHLGHVRHLEAAAREGDMLIVTCTIDENVNKGPDRPVFHDQIRAEMLAAMECVDWAGISHYPTAEQVIDIIKPDAYVKGQDYANSDEDVTGGIDAERQAVEAHGGKVVFTEDITFSSSTLINEHFARFDPEVQSYLDEMRNNDLMEKAMKAIESIADLKVLVVGDAIIDEYQYTVPMGKSAKENIIASRFDGREVFAGGVVAAANHLSTFCKEVEVITCLGRRDSHEDLIRESLNENVSASFIYRRGVPTTRKCRFVDPGHMRKLFEVYHFDDAPLSGHAESEFCKLIAEKAPNYDVVIVTDFGHGLMTQKAINKVTEKAQFLAVNAQSNSANHGYNLITKYREADYICIDAPEARLATADRFTDLGVLIEDNLRDQIDCQRFAVTHGENGSVVFEPENGVSRVPAFTRQVVDTVGAGDAFLAITSPIVAKGASMEVAGFIGNAVGALKVGIVGHRQSVGKVPLVKFLTALLK